jgi:hypothetical protein
LPDAAKAPPHRHEGPGLFDLNITCADYGIDGELEIMLHF